MSNKAEIRQGTSGFAAAGGTGNFCPSGLKTSDYLSYYARHFLKVEPDSTFYRIPSLSTVRGWYAKTPAAFIFGAKMPQTITHENWNRAIVDRCRELREWVNVVYKINGRGIPVFAYANNHYAGHAPATVELFRELWNEQTKS